MHSVKASFAGFIVGTFIHQYMCVSHVLVGIYDCILLNIIE